jgi:hypothetical protein
MTDEVEQITHEYEPEVKGGSFVMRIAKEGQVTVDGRVFDKGSIAWRNPPVPLMFIRENDPSGRGGHKSSFAAGVISDIWKDEDEDGFATVYGRGYFSTDEDGQKARQLVKEGVISGVSADVGGAIVEELEAEFDEHGEERLTKRIKYGEVVAVTALPIPAFDDMKISITASSASESWKPKAQWFQKPELDGPTPITVTADGRVYGHIAEWGTCHIGHRDRCVTPPRSKNNYRYFNVGQVLTAEDEVVNVGRLTAGTNHAEIELGAQPAREHYDNEGWAAAYVHSGEDEYGIWVAGAVAPGATDEQIARIRASSVSGDWRSINGSLELVGVLAVNSPGFPIARAGIVAGAQVSLIASGLIASGGEDCGCGCKGTGDCGEKKKKGAHAYANEDDLVFGETDEEVPAQEAEVEVEKKVEPQEDDGEADFKAQLAAWDVELLFPETL